MLTVSVICWARLIKNLYVVDKAEASCGQCLRSGHFCRGYQRILRIQHYVAMNHDSARSSYVATNKSTIPNDRCLTRVAMERLNEDLHSYFHSVYQWAPFWYPMLKGAIDAGSPAVSRLCSQAITYVCWQRDSKPKRCSPSPKTFIRRRCIELRSWLSSQIKRH